MNQAKKKRASKRSATEDLADRYTRNFGRPQAVLRRAESGDCGSLEQPEFMDVVPTVTTYLSAQGDALA